MFPEGFLQWMELAVLGQALNGHQLRSIGLHRQHQTRAGGFAIDENRTGTADAVLTADMRARQTKVFTQKINQQFARLSLPPALRAVDAERDLSRLAVFVRLAHALRSWPRSMARLIARRVSTWVRCRRKSAEAWISLSGSTSSAALAAAR